MVVSWDYWMREVYPDMMKAANEHYSKTYEDWRVTYEQTRKTFASQKLCSGCGMSLRQPEAWDQAVWATIVDDSGHYHPWCWNAKYGCQTLPNVLPKPGLIELIERRVLEAWDAGL